MINQSWTSEVTIENEDTRKVDQNGRPVLYQVKRSQKTETRGSPYRTTGSTLTHPPGEHVCEPATSAYFEVPAQRGSQARTACVAERLEPKAVPLRLLYLTPARFELPEQTINMEPRQAYEVASWAPRAPPLAFLSRKVCRA